MPTPSLFAAYPDFPAEIPIATSQTLTLGQFEQDGETASDQLYQVCREFGYFLLDLRGCARGERLLSAAERMFDVNTQTFELGEDVLTEFAAGFPKDHRGYKRTGQFTVEDGKPDAVEIYTICQDEVTGIGPSKEKPKALDDRRADCKDFVCSAHEVVSILFNALDRALDLPEGTLARLNPIDRGSPTAFRMLRSHPQVTGSAEEKQLHRINVAGHTDIGTITLVFNVVGGLQILPAGHSNTGEHWRYVKPAVGCVLVQVGDTLVEWTGGLLRSNLHRVVDPPGPQADSVRQSLVYLSRPAYGGSMQRLKGGRVIPAPGPGELEETMLSDEWATWRTKQIMTGELKPVSHGGIAV